VYIELNVELIDGIFVDGIFEQKFINNFRPIINKPGAAAKNATLRSHSMRINEIVHVQYR
jgi:hypothetical protein